MEEEYESASEDAVEEDGSVQILENGADRTPPIALKRQERRD